MRVISLQQCVHFRIYQLTVTYQVTFHRALRCRRRHHKLAAPASSTAIRCSEWCVQSLRSSCRRPRCTWYCRWKLAAAACGSGRRVSPRSWQR